MIGYALSSGKGMEGIAQSQGNGPVLPLVKCGNDRYLHKGIKLRAAFSFPTMSAFRRPAVLALFVGILLTGYFCFATAHVSGVPTARTPYGRLFGVLGFATIVGSSLSRLWEQDGAPQAMWGTWHNVLGFLSVWLILLHSHLHFGSGIALLAFLLLILVVASGAVTSWLSHPSASTLLRPRPTRAPAPPTAQAHVRQERWLLFHLVLTVGLLTFSLFHILTTLYY